MKKKKIGRPKLPENERRRHQVIVLLNDDEMARLDDRATDGRSAYFRDMLNTEVGR